MDGDKAYLRVTPVRGTHRFSVKGKLTPRYVGPFNILSRRGENTYRLELPEKLSKVHDVFHVSQLKKCFKDPDRAVDHETIELQEDLSYEEHPVRILDEAERRTRNKSTSSSKCNGLIILIKRQRGKPKRIFARSTAPFSLLRRNLGARFLQGGAFCNIPSMKTSQLCLFFVLFYCIMAS